MAALLQSWSVIVRMVSYLPDFGSFVMKSIAIVWNGSPFTGAMGNIGGFKGWVLILLALQAAHPLTYCLASWFMFGHQKSHFISSFLLPIPGCPADGVSW